MIKKLLLKFFKKEEVEELEPIEIGLGSVGIKYKGSEILEILQPGLHRGIDKNEGVKLMKIEMNKERWSSNDFVLQTALTKDMISLRFSFIYTFSIVDVEKYFYMNYDRNELNRIVEDVLEKYVKSVIAGMNSDELIEKRERLEQLELDGLKEKFDELGVLVENVIVTNLTYPKGIQNLFAKRLATKIKAETELANARTLVATARTLKNASKMMEGDENIKFLKYLETISKIAETGRHSFVIERPFK
jgi:regulator of protease activity HflC (stomatin/prohibitin superfamily)